MTQFLVNGCKNTRGTIHCASMQHHLTSADEILYALISANCFNQMFW